MVAFLVMAQPACTAYQHNDFDSDDDGDDGTMVLLGEQCCTSVSSIVLKVSPHSHCMPPPNHTL